jgi:hypothetical protein
MIVEPLDRADLALAWGSLPGVRDAAEKDGTIAISLHDGADIGELMRQAASLAPVRRLEVQRASLEDIFISIVGAGGGETAEQLRMELAAGKGSTTEELAEVSRG